MCWRGWHRLAARSPSQFGGELDNQKDNVRRIGWVPVLKRFRQEIAPSFDAYNVSRARVILMVG
jgi:hypothetical protein